MNTNDARDENFFTVIVNTESTEREQKTITIKNMLPKIRLKSSLSSHRAWCVRIYERVKDTFNVIWFNAQMVFSSRWGNFSHFPRMFNGLSRRENTWMAYIGYGKGKVKVKVRWECCEGQNEQKRPFPSLLAKRLEQIIVLGSIFLSRMFNAAKVISFQWYHNKDVCPILKKSSWNFLKTADYIIKCRHNASKEQKVRCWSEWSRGRLTNGVWRAEKVARWTSQVNEDK